MDAYVTALYFHSTSLTTVGLTHTYCLFLTHKHSPSPDGRVRDGTVLHLHLVDHRGLNTHILSLSHTQPLSLSRWTRTWRHCTSPPPRSPPLVSVTLPATPGPRRYSASSLCLSEVIQRFSRLGLDRITNLQDIRPILPNIWLDTEYPTQNIR